MSSVVKVAKRIHSFPDQLFEVKNDEYMKKALESVKEFGVVWLTISGSLPTFRHQVFSH